MSPGSWELHELLTPDDERCAARRNSWGRSRMSTRSPRSMWKTMSSNTMPLSFGFFLSEKH